MTENTDGNKQTLREKVYEKLRSTIISGDIFPGQILTLRALSEQFEVSIVPVREALFQLESEGAIVRRNNRDYRVNTLTIEQFKEIYRIRNLNEIYIARRACRMQPPDAKAELDDAYKGLKASLKNTKDYISYNQKFHFTIYSYGDMPMLLDIIRGLWARIGPYLSIHMDFLENLSSSIDVHTRMYRYFIKQDTEKFISHLREDLKESYRSLTPLVKKLQMDSNTDFRKFLLSKIF